MNSLLFLVLSYFNMANISTEQYYKDDLSHYQNQKGNIIVEDFYYKDMYLYSRNYISFKDWNIKYFKENFGLELREKILASLSEKTRTKGGIIPDIDLSLKMPKGLERFIGEGGKITVDGSQSISLDVSRHQSSSVVGETGSAFPQIEFEQRLRANIHGTVGEKIHVKINHDSEAQEQDNKIKLWYEGNEDDIIQRIDAGDLSQLGGTRNQDVFGIQTKGMVGSTSFNIIAGKIESNTSTNSENYSISSDTSEMYERSYVKNKFYYTGLTPDDSLMSISVFIEETEGLEHRTAKLIDINGDSLGENAEFSELTYDEDYELRYLRLSDGSLFPFLIINEYHNEKRLGLWYIYKNATGVIDTLGLLPDAGDTLDTLVLAQLRPRNPNPNYTSWDLMMRNVYSFDNINPTSVDVTIYKIVSGGEDSEIEPGTGKEYVELLGLDSDGNGTIDPTQVLWSEGCILFPYEKPFLLPALNEDTVPSIYREQSPENDEGKNFRIVVSSSSSKKEFIIQGDLVDSSEVIVLNNTDTLTRGIDYNIEYNTGLVTFSNELPLTPDSKISYTYDTKPLFSFTSRYIAKTNINAHPIENSNLDMDLAFRSSSNPDPHPMVGSEPSNITLGQISFSTENEPRWYNTLINKIPFVDDENKSKIRINSSYGFSVPNPATNNKSYLDDMESVKLSRELELSAKYWNYCSLTDSIEKLGKIDWFNSRVIKTDIYPELPVEQRNQWMSTMVFYFQPNDTLSNPGESWGGIMKSFPAEEDFSKKRFIEVWVKGNEGTLLLDLGTKMNEDIPRWGKARDGTDSLISPNGQLDTEDRNDNFELEPGEDTGLDGIKFDDSKWSYISDSLDDGRDDYSDKLDTFSDSLKLHRKEGNRRLDSEDLNKDHVLENNSDFYRYEFNLESTALVVNEGRNGWKLYRLPLLDSNYHEKFGDPSFENILYSRIWFRGMDSTTRITVSSFSIVGNSWEHIGVRNVQNDSLSANSGSFLLTYRNSFEDSDYIPPVEREREVYGGYSKEQSLTFKIDSLQNNHYCLAESYLELPQKRTGKGYDLRLYKSLRFYTRLEDSNTDSIKIFLRIMTDSSNYYQYSKEISLNNWDTLDVNFQEFYNLKLNNDTLRGNYLLKGNPSMDNIAYLQLGVTNNNTSAFSGEVYFDDIILMGANSEMGNDIDLSIKSNMGNFIPEISYHLKKKSPQYKDNLNALRNIGNNEIIRHNVKLKTNTGKMIGDLLNIPVSYQFDRSTDIPIYKKNSDILLPEENRGNEASENTDHILSFNLSKTTPSENPLLKYTIDNMRFNGSYSLDRNFSPRQKADTVVNKQGSFNYNIPVPQIQPPLLSGQGSSILPGNLSFNLGYQNRSTRKYNYRSEDSSYVRTSVKPIRKANAGGGFSYNPIRWVNFDYDINATQDLINTTKRTGENVSFSEGISVNHHSVQLGINDISVNYTNNFDLNHGRDYSKTLGDSLDVRSVHQRRTIRITDNLNVSQIFQKIPVLSTLSDNIKSIDITATQSKDASFAYLGEMPDYKFRYGIEQRPQIDKIILEDPSDGGDISRGLNISTTINISKIKINLNGAISDKRPNKTKLDNSVSANKTFTLKFPGMNVYIPDIENYIPGGKSFLRSGDLNISINRDSSYTKSIKGGDYSSGRSELNISPKLSLNFKNDMGLEIRAGYTTRDQNTERTYLLHTNTIDKNLEVEGSYSFRPRTGIPLPLLRNLKLEKPINLNLTFSYEEGKETSTNYSTYKTEINTDNRRIRIKFNGNYNFSNMVSGGIFFNYHNFLNRKIANDVTSSYGGGFNVEFKF